MNLTQNGTASGQPVVTWTINTCWSDPAQAGDIVATQPFGYFWNQRSGIFILTAPLKANATGACTLEATSSTGNAQVTVQVHVNS